MSIRKLSTSLISSQTTVTPGAYLSGFGSAYATSITIPTHQVGDVIVICARAGAQNVGTTPQAAGGTVPTWTQFQQSAASGYGVARGYYCIATANNHTSGTFTSATGIMVAVVRRASGIGPSAGSVQTAIPWTAPAVTLTKSNNTSVVLHFFGWGDAVNGTPASFSAAPQGYTQRFANRTTLVAQALHTKNTTDCAPPTVLTTPATIVYGSQITVEVLAS
jgi:hypothetical protein